MKLIDRMLLRNFFKAWLVCFFSLVSLYIVIDVFNKLDQFIDVATQTETNLFEIMGVFYSYQLVLIFDRLCGVIILLAAMFTVTWMLRNNELLPLLSAGVSTRRVLQPVLLGTLHIHKGSAQLTYTSPTHTNVLATYSRFLVTEQAANEEPIIPSLDPATWRYAGNIADTPTPGDANHYSLLSHLRHLLAKDPTLEGIGLSGGLDIWLYRNTGKILEWSSAARDDWAGGQASLALMRRQIERVLDYLDGAAFVWRDVPPDTPWLVDPQAGHIGLLELEQGQNPPGYLAHIDFHLVGYANSPGVTTDQKGLAN